MAQFIGKVRGQRGNASRLGTKASGIVATAAGWDIGGEVVMSHDSDGRDVVTFYLTSGSNNRQNGRMVARFTLNGQGQFHRLDGGE